MIPLIIFVSLSIIGIVLSIIIARESSSPNGWDYIMHIIIGFIITLVLSIFLILLLQSIFALTRLEPVQYRIQSIADNSEIHGSFVLGSGSINSETYYCYYYNHIDGGYALGKTSTNNSRIIEWNKSYAVREVNYSICDSEWWIVNRHRTGGTIFRVPRGTIKRRFNLDSSY